MKERIQVTLDIEVESEHVTPVIDSILFHINGLRAAYRATVMITQDGQTIDDKHWADKPILRDLFWFLVLPSKLRSFLRH